MLLWSGDNVVCAGAKTMRRWVVGNSDGGAHGVREAKWKTKQELPEESHQRMYSLSQPSGEGVRDFDSAIGLSVSVIMIMIHHTLVPPLIVIFLCSGCFALVE